MVVITTTRQSAQQPLTLQVMSQPKITPHRDTSEFLSLTHYKTGDKVFIDPAGIGAIQSLPEDSSLGLSRRTRIDMRYGNLVFFVTEEAIEVALSSGRGFFGPADDKG